jgi:Autotransporter beta-domain
MAAHFNQYSENGGPLAALTYQWTNISSVAGVVGLRGSVDIRDGANTYTPNLRIEYARSIGASRNRCSTARPERAKSMR